MVFRDKAPDGTTRVTGVVPPTMQQIIDLLYPVNTIHFSVDNVNPSTRLGGTWVAWGSGMVPVGVNSADPAFDVTEKVGGEKNHLLTVSEMPTHSHTGPLSMGWPQNYNSTEHGPNNWGTNSWPATPGTSGTYDAGGGQSHNNLQPYITCYMWKRTA